MDSIYDLNCVMFPVWFSLGKSEVKSQSDQALWFQEDVIQGVLWYANKECMSNSVKKANKVSR